MPSARNYITKCRTVASRFDPVIRLSFRTCCRARNGKREVREDACTLDWIHCGSLQKPGAEAPGQHIPYFLLCNCNCPLFQPDPDNGQRADCHCRQITKDRPNRQWMVLFRRRRCRRKHHDHDKQTDEKNKGYDSFHGIGHPF